jgi:pimeloyl-ACP methyl ester carboxylesterase
VKRASFAVEVPGGSLHGWSSANEGPPVLLLHGGPGVSFDYLDGLAEEIGHGFRVAAYQQRGIEPSTLEGPFEVEREIADALAVLNALGWDAAWLVGHSWGGHLLLHIAVAAPERLHGGLAIDPLGAVGDGGQELFEAEMLRRTPEADRRLAEELDERAMRGEGTADESLESMRLVWPAYFASPDRVMPFPPTRVSVPAYSGLLASMTAARPQLESALADLQVPLGFVAGALSPMPCGEAAGLTAGAIATAWLEVVEGAGHFPWFERPGCVRSALNRLTGTAPARQG